MAVVTARKPTLGTIDAQLSRLSVRLLMVETDRIAMLGQMDRLLDQRLALTRPVSRRGLG